MRRPRLRDALDLAAAPEDGRVAGVPRHGRLHAARRLRLQRLPRAEGPRGGGQGIVVG